MYYCGLSNYYTMSYLDLTTITIQKESTEPTLVPMINLDSWSPATPVASCLDFTFSLTEDVGSDFLSQAGSIRVLDVTSGSTLFT